MFGKKKATDEFKIAELEKIEYEKKVSDESYLDSLLDIMMEDHEDDSSSVVEEDTSKEDVLEEDSNAIDNIEEYIEQVEDEQNELMLDTEEELLEDFDSEEVQLDDDINHDDINHDDIDHDDILQGLDEIVSGADSQEDLLENIFDEPEENEEEDEVEIKSKPEKNEPDFILKDSEEITPLVKPGKPGKTEKVGFIKSLFGKILKHAEEPEEVIESGEIDYHAENKRLLSEMDEEDENQQVKGKKGKKDKKEKKEKKTKAGKTPKIKKAKDPELEEKVKITPRVGFLLFSIIIVIVVGVLAGGSVLSYRQKMADATDFFVTKNYSAAYKMVESTNLKKTDEEFYQQLRLIMYVHRYYESYLNFKEMGNDAKALDSLVKGVGNYELYKDQGRDYNVLEEMQYSLGLVKEALQSEYNVTETQAREMYLIDDRNIYSTQIYEIIDNKQ